MRSSNGGAPGPPALQRERQRGSPTRPPSVPSLDVVAITGDHARAFGRYRYPEPYAIYNTRPDSYGIFVDSTLRYFAVVDPAAGPEDLALWGFCCFGAEARVAGGDYRATEPEILDVGVGMCPTRIGRGAGRVFAAAILERGWANHRPEAFRVTVASFNLRSLRVWARLGFTETETFERPMDGFEFTVMSVSSSRLRSIPPRAFGTMHVGRDGSGNG